MRSTKASAQAWVWMSGLRCRRSSPGPGCRRAQRRAGCTRSSRSRASLRSQGCQVRRTQSRRLVQRADNTHLRHPSATADRQGTRDHLHSACWRHSWRHCSRVFSEMVILVGLARRTPRKSRKHHLVYRLSATPRASQSHDPPGGPARACCAQREPSRRRLSCPGTGCQRRSRC